MHSLCPKPNTLSKIASLFVASLFVPCVGFAQLGPGCTVSILNRTVAVSADGSWALPNIPDGFGRVRARATCVNNGTNVGDSLLFTLPVEGTVYVPPIVLGFSTATP